MFARIAARDARFVADKKRHIRLSMAFRLSANRGDIDNFIKGTMDAMQGIFYDNDAQVVEVYASKRKAGAGEKPGCLIEVHEAAA